MIKKRKLDYTQARVMFVSQEINSILCNMTGSFLKNSLFLGPEEDFSSCLTVVFT